MEEERERRMKCVPDSFFINSFLFFGEAFSTSIVDLIIDLLGDIVLRSISALS